MMQEFETVQGSFKSYHATFHQLLGSSPSLVLLREDPDDVPLFHEACIYHAPTKSIFVTSNQMALPEGQIDDLTSDKVVKVTRVYDHDDLAKITCVDATPTELIMANGGVNYKSGLLFCALGNHSKFSSGLVHVPDPSPPYTGQVMVSSYHRRAFNSVNDVVVHPKDGSIWFTDPCYGYHQGIRPEPELPNQVYRYDPSNGNVRAMADSFSRPNGLCFSPDLKILYITDTGADYGGVYHIPFDATGEASVYAFDVLDTDRGKFALPVSFLSRRPKTLITLPQGHSSPTGVFSPL
jgi:gluconolactonase